LYVSVKPLILLKAMYCMNFSFLDYFSRFVRKTKMGLVGNYNL